MSAEGHEAGHAAAAHGGHSAADIDKHVKVYITVFVSLMVLTVITVAVSYLHLSVVPAVALALVIATIKASLVACYFMHLISEKKLIFVVLAFTVLFFLFVLIGPLVTDLDRIEIRAD